MGFICGIEDAGRGPVLGPLVMAAVIISEEQNDLLRSLGVKDSKLIPAEKREELAAEIKRIATAWEAICVQPEEIDAALVSQQSNLNFLEADTSIRLIQKLNPEKVIVDCPSRNTDAYRNYILKKVSCAVISEHKADVNYPVVSAASIIAKTTRDAAVETLKKEIGIDFGSGYMSDEKTVAFIDTHWESHSHLFRKKWESYQERIRRKQQKSLGEY